MTFNDKPIPVGRKKLGTSVVELHKETEAS